MFGGSIFAACDYFGGSYFLLFRLVFFVTDVCLRRRLEVVYKLV